MATWGGLALSAAARSCWGKSGPDGDEPMPLWRHLSDTAEIAGLLWDRWLAPPVQRVIADGRPDPVARAVLIWLAGAHDLGKATPAFAAQVRSLTEPMRQQGLPFSRLVEQPPRTPHAHQSHRILRAWLEARGFDRDTADSWAIVPGGHHGVEPARDDIAHAGAPAQAGTDRWVDVQRELADWVAENSDVLPHLETLRASALAPTAQVMITAVVIVADWIASDVARFPCLDPRPTADRVRTGWRDVGLLPAWKAQAGMPDTLFDRRFGAEGHSARPVQVEVVRVAQAMARPELMIIEAPMGEGKTEAALAAAETLATRFGCGGVAFALPTMATADAMLDRFTGWLSLAAESAQPFFLAHSKAPLNSTFAAMRRLSPTVGDRDRDGCGADVAVALEWLTGRKKGMLANFVVGTIDQVLYAALRGRHVVLRHLALAGKVVVIDEVHAADVHMAVYLHDVLHWLGAYRVPVILLSATLPALRRHELLTAYDSGARPDTWMPPVPSVPDAGRAARRRRPGAAAPPTAPPAAKPNAGPEAGVQPYPLVTSTSSDRECSAAPPAAGVARSVRVEFAGDDDATLLGLVKAAAVDGGVVGVVRNTVGRAQQTAAWLRSEFGDDVVTLTHSRFLAVDRMSRERELLAELGAPGRATRRTGLRIIVGTQVLEQSLDIDLDLLVTDLAPLDLILQRMGRLHRHRRPAQERGRMVEPRCVVVGVDWAVEPVEPVRGSVAVYGRAALLRAAAVLLADGPGDRVVELPEDIPRLVESAYADQIAVPESWRAVFDEAELAAHRERANRIAGAEMFAVGRVPVRHLFGWSHANAGDAEGHTGRASVRDGEDGLEVLAVQQRGNGWFVLPWIGGCGGVELPKDDPPAPRLARAVAQCSLRLPRQLSVWRVDQVIGELEPQGRAAWQQSPWVRGELILPFDEDLTAEVAGFRLRYSRRDGLVVEEE